MTRLPVVATVAEAFWFAARELWTNIRVGWLPYLAMTLTLVAAMVGALVMISGSQGLVAVYNGVVQGDMFGGAAAVGRLDGVLAGFGVLFVGVFLATAFFGAYAVPIYRLVVFGERPAKGFFNWRLLGPQQIRFAAANIIYAGLGLVFMIGPVLASWLFVLNALSKKTAYFPNPVSLHTVDIVPAAPFPFLYWGALGAVVLVAIYISMRLALFLPATAALKKIAPLKAWRLTRGVALKLFLMHVLFFIVAYAVLLGVSLAIEASSATFSMLGRLALNAAALSSPDGAEPAWLAAAFSWFGVAAVIAMNIVYEFFRFGAQLGLLAAAYRRLAQTA